jgi:CBS domain containing-hemolysin-like protein
MNGDRAHPDVDPATRPNEPETAAADEVEDGPNFFSRLFGLLSKPPTNGELAAALDGGDGAAARSLPRTRREMIERVIAFDEKRVADVMAPRADIVAVDVDTPLDALVRAFADAGHSRMPIFRGDLDDPLGMVHIKDVMTLVARPEDAAGAEPVLKKIRRDVLYVPPSMLITDLLLRMQASRIHMALVIDEYGGTDGLVTIEDLVEEIVGDINDEHDEDEAPTISPRPGGGWEADARVELSEFALQTGISVEAAGEEADTLGGLVTTLAGRVPQRGEVISHPAGLDFEVTEADARKIRKLRIRRAGPGDVPVSPAI